MKTPSRFAVAVIATLALTSTLHAKTIHSSNLGWKAGEDVSVKFGTVLNNQVVRAGDQLVIEHTYQIHGTYKIPDNVTLSASKDAGFEVTDAKSNHKPFLELGDDSSLRNLTITYLNTPELGGRSYKHGVDFFDKRGISASGKRGVLIENCRMTGMISHHIGLSNCVRPRVIGCHVIGGFWAVTISGKDLLFRNCLFEKSCCDNVKGGADGALFERCVFQDTCRDGIDTTGGLNDTIIRNCIFRRLGCTGLDLKSHYEKSLDRPENVGIRIEKCEFYDMPNAVVLTTLDNGRRKGGPFLLTADNMKEYAPHDIEMSDCIVGHVEKPLLRSKQGGYGVDYPKQGEHMRVILLKDAYDIRYKDIRLTGHKIMPVLVHTIGGSRALSKAAADAIDRGATGNVLDEPAVAPKAGDVTISFTCGPQVLH